MNSWVRKRDAVRAAGSGPQRHDSNGKVGDPGVAVPAQAGEYGLLVAGGHGVADIRCIAVLQ